MSTYFSYWNTETSANYASGFINNQAVHYYEFDLSDFKLEEFFNSERVANFTHWLPSGSGVVILEEDLETYEKFVQSFPKDKINYLIYSIVATLGASYTRADYYPIMENGYVHTAKAQAITHLDRCKKYSEKVRTIYGAKVKEIIEYNQG